MAWQGDKTNQPPNTEQESVVRSEVKTDVNRANQTRRDNDVQKNFTVRLIDVDTAILRQLEKFQLTVTDEGKQTKVPIFYSNPEKWKSIQKDGFMRDYNGKILLPALVFKRTNSEKDQSLILFNRYLNYPVLKKYSDKNRYTPFNLLIGQNVPINDVYDVVMPDHMVFTYHFIVWTEYVEQMNTIVERINFESEDYWGDLKGLRFRTKIDSMSHAIELQSDQDRMVKTEFDLSVRGYLLPDVIDTFQGKKLTTSKHITPKKVVMGVEVVNTNFDFDNLNKNKEKIRNQNYPNLQADDIIPSPPIVFNDIVVNSERVQSISSLLVSIAEKSQSNTFHLPAPANSSDTGEEGWVSHDDDYYYIFTSGSWKRVPIELFNAFNTF